MATCDSYDFLAEIPVKSWSLCRLSSQFGIVDTQLSRDAPAAKFMLGHGARHGFQRCWNSQINLGKISNQIGGCSACCVALIGWFQRHHHSLSLQLRWHC